MQHLCVLATLLAGSGGSDFIRPADYINSISHSFLKREHMSRTSTPIRISTPIKWKVKLRLLYRLRSLAGSPCSPEDTPKTPEADFLTPLDAYDDIYFTPLTDQKDITLGELTLPPPPPPQRAKWASMDPDSQLLDSMSPKSPGPRVKPYFATANRQAASTSDVCFICQELLETTLYLEKLVPLLCGDRVHEECLKMAAEHELEKKLYRSELSKSSSTTEMIHAVFPRCHGSHCKTKGETPMATPSNIVFMDDLIGDLRLSMKLTRFEENRTLDPKKDNTAAGQLETYPSFPHNKAKQVPKVPLKIDTGGLSRRSSLFSNSSVKTAATASVRVSVHNSIRPEDLKLAFIQYMINHAPGFDLSMLVCLGKLRLVDQLLVSVERSAGFESANVYLFTNYLAIWSEENPPLFMMLPLTLSTVINTPIPSVLQVSSSGPETPYSVRLHSEISSIIEKWGIAILDDSIAFPPNIFSSTLRLPDIAKTFEAPQTKRPRVSPIMESSSEFTPTVADIEKDLLACGLEVYSDSPDTPISRPTSPLQPGRYVLERNPPSSGSSTRVGSENDVLDIADHRTAAFDKLGGKMKILDSVPALEDDSDSDSDKDLDCELINRVMNSL